MSIERTSIADIEGKKMTAKWLDGPLGYIGFYVGKNLLLKYAARSCLTAMAIILIILYWRIGCD